MFPSRDDAGAFRRVRARLAGLLLVLAAGSVVPAAGSEEDAAAALVARFADRIYQVRVIDLASGSRSSLGSGFRVGGDGLLATNFHVVAEFVHDPQRFRLEYAGHDDRTGALMVRDVDVVNDLALLTGAPAGEPLALAAEPVQRGDALYSIGNPFDLGMSVVPGTHNGIVQRSFLERILFSGSVNPGMSGGPVLDRHGSVAGINVATSGEQVSFLVPVQRLADLLAAPPAAGALRARIGAQLAAHSERLMAHVLAAQWPTSPLGDAHVLGELTPIIRCFGRSDGGRDEDRRLFDHVQSQCLYNESIYLSDSLTSNVIQYEFHRLKARVDAPLRLYGAWTLGMFPATSGGEDDVTAFSCHEDFVTVAAMAAGGTVKAVFCTRAYAGYPGLYDVLFNAVTMAAGDEILAAHFSLSGVGRDAALAFTRRFVAGVSWR
jgi:hypothetical protein